MAYLRQTHVQRCKTISCKRRDTHFAVCSPKANSVPCGEIWGTFNHEKCLICVLCAVSTLLYGHDFQKPTPVYRGWGAPMQKLIRIITTSSLSPLGQKVQTACGACNTCMVVAYSACKPRASVTNSTCSVGCAIRL